MLQSDWLVRIPPPYTTEDALQIPAVFKCDQGTVCDGTEDLCILLKRFAYPCRYSNMIPMFGKPVPEICMINNTVRDWVYDNHRHHIMDWNQTVLSAIQLESYVDVIFNKGAPLTNCFGFVDGTVRPISRPGESQRLVYNGHKRVHGLKFQSVVVPSGLIAHLYGPVGKPLSGQFQVAGQFKVHNVLISPYGIIHPNLCFENHHDLIANL